MAEGTQSSSSTPWIAFLVGIVLVVVASVAYFSLSGQAPQRQAALEINAPDIDAPDIHLPPPPDVTPDTGATQSQ